MSLTRALMTQHHVLGTKNTGGGHQAFQTSWSAMASEKRLQQGQQQQRLTTIHTRTSTSTTRSSSSSSSSTRLNLWSRNDDDDEIQDFGIRLKCCFPYMLPLLDGDMFGRYIYERIPPLGFVDDILLAPLVNIYEHVPFLNLLFFVALTLGTRFNFEMDRDIRFNAQQAALVDVMLILPELIGSGFEEGDVPRYLAEPSCNFVWYAYMTAVWYCVYSNLVKGKKPSDIPFLSNYAETMVGPF
eukprot:CAMPEP_0198141182 /NCGR_PEP_ID=MMETSP1443-20131203/4222_1 /TAXON_ID=186043 /ORGANISM="Entomoneis sp., Strain CCMP2396" /LENGTH=241 /DNA_ID=CAMNT_0043803835 /DNA_START=252 /DNA_END=977 /DNA_ORIENTATION=-